MDSGNNSAGVVRVLRDGQKGGHFGYQPPGSELNHGAGRSEGSSFRSLVERLDAIQPHS